MRSPIQTTLIIWISIIALTGCVSSKEKIFGTDMPTMIEIHQEKFSSDASATVISPGRAMANEPMAAATEYQWLPNPVMNMYVTSHLTDSGQPVPGYTTYFRFYTSEHIAAPGELQGWD